MRNRSDADSDVLADYVIALLKHDGDRDAVRKLCEQEIPDFLSEGVYCQVICYCTGGQQASILHQKLTVVYRS